MKSIMNQKNVEFLEKQLKYNGFGDKLAEGLKQNVAEEKDKFQLTHEAEFNGHKVLAMLDFNKSKESDMYFFNRYNVKLTPENMKESLSQNFYIQNKGDNITLKEAYNLMNGRAVYKELANKDNELYKAWVKLDFKDTDNGGNFRLKKYNENYGFNLEEAIGKYPIMEVIDQTEKERLVQSLQKGNRQAITFNMDGTMEKRFIEANPTAHNLNVYDSQQQIILQKQVNGEKQAENLKNSQKVADEQKPAQEQKRQYKQRQS